MSDKACKNCKWFVERSLNRTVCKNPMNDGLYDHFITNTGDTIFNIRVMTNVMRDDVCGEFTKVKARTAIAGE